MNNVQKIIKEICEEEGISFSLVSKNWIMILEKDTICKTIVGYKFGLNNHASGLICDDKFAFYEVLKHASIPVVEHFILFKNYKKEDVFSYAQRYQFLLVVKSNTGTCGNDCFFVSSLLDLYQAIDSLFMKYDSISLSPYYQIKNEYRVILLNGEILLFYGKKKPVVIGDGVSTLYELLYQFNPYYFSKIKKEIANKVLPFGESYTYNWQFNLSKGAVPFLECDENLKKRCEKLAISIAKQLELSFVSIDIIELDTGELLALEANSGVMIDHFIPFFENGRGLAKSVYKKAIQKLFKID